MMTGDEAVVQERQISGVGVPRREVTDKPNNIRAPIKGPMF